MTDPANDVTPERALISTANEYLQSGGLFNPELMDHEKVRDLVIKMRDHIRAGLVKPIDPDEAVILGALAQNVSYWRGVDSLPTERDRTEASSHLACVRPLLRSLAARLSRLAAERDGATRIYMVTAERLDAALSDLARARGERDDANAKAHETWLRLMDKQKAWDKLSGCHDELQNRIEELQGQLTAALSQHQEDAGRMEGKQTALLQAIALIEIPAKCHEPVPEGCTGTPRYSAGLVKLHAECHALLPLLRQAINDPAAPGPTLGGVRVVRMPPRREHDFASDGSYYDADQIDAALTEAGIPIATDAPPDASGSPGDFPGADRAVLRQLPM